MESEACFLFVVYNQEPAYATMQGNTEIHDTTFVIRKCILKVVRKQEGLIYKRIVVDFDPLELIDNAEVYIVVLRIKTTSPRIIQKHIIHFPSIHKTLEEAETAAKFVEGGGWKSLAEKKQEFDRVEVIPALITKE